MPTASMSASPSSSDSMPNAVEIRWQSKASELSPRSSSTLIAGSSRKILGPSSSRISTTRMVSPFSQGLIRRLSQNHDQVEYCVRDDWSRSAVTHAHFTEHRADQEKSYQDKRQSVLRVQQSKEQRCHEDTESRLQRAT